ncbi:MAG: hypothetical protein ACYTAF_04665 [Planctomycetota bacterium]|jgi:hypothetical protein
MVRALPVLLLAALLVCGAQDSVDLKWMLGNGEAAEYRVLDGNTRRETGEDLWVLGCELRGDGSNRILIDRHRDVPFHFLFLAAGRTMRKGDSWERAADFFFDAVGLGAAKKQDPLGWVTEEKGFIPLRAKGSFTFAGARKTDDGTEAQVEGAFEFLEIRNDPLGGGYSVSGNKMGTLRTTQIIDPAKGILLKGAYVLTLRGQERAGSGKIRNVKCGGSRIVELVRVVPLEPERMKKSVDGGVKKAVAWLRGRQKKNGDFGPATATEEACLLNVTPYALRALLAAGVAVDDPAVERAYKYVQRLRGDAVQEIAGVLSCAAIMRYLQAGKSWEKAAKDLSKKDRAVLKRFAGVLLSLRDAATGAWPTSTKGGMSKHYNVISTAHAIEALRLISKIGVEVADVWKGQVDRLAKSGTQEAGEVDLEVVFAPGKEPGLDPEGDKKAAPCSWPVAAAGGGRGTGLSTASALWVLLCSEAKLREGDRLDDSLARSTDAAKRAGIAYLQERLSFRSVPPAEGRWSRRVPDWLFCAGRVLSACNITTIGGVDWHLAGCYALLQEQREDGSWDFGGGEPVADTVFALLFLARAFPELP